MIKELRERTQAGMSDCKSALTEAEGNVDKAVEIILKKGIVKAASREGRVAAEGEVRTWIDPEGKRGVIVEVNCQTDFVSRGDEFRAFVGVCVDAAKSLAKGSDLTAQTVNGKSLDTIRQEVIAKTGENTVVRRWDAIEAKAPNEKVHAYIHMGGKLAVLVRAEAPSAEARKSVEFTQFIENCAMQIAAMNPVVVAKDQITPSMLDKQKEIYAAQLKEEGKPEQAWPKIIEGKVAKWFTEVTLLGQDNVWAPDQGTIDKVRVELGKKLGGEVKVHEFVRFGLGEGIQRKTDDLAEEVAKLTGG
jgi:elongation factor Ts